MKEESKQFSDEQLDYVCQLMEKASAANEKTKKYANCDLNVDGRFCSIRVDDKQLLSIAVRLIPNVVNYMVNVLPTIIYPFIVAFLQDLSDDDQPITINDLYDIVSAIENDILRLNS